MKKTVILSIILLALISSCSPKTSTSPEESIAAAVSATLAAQPAALIQPTYTPYPTFAPYVPDLKGLFCEYQFCIGHPTEIALFDVRKAENPSLYGDGMLAAYNSDLFLLTIWQRSNSDDPQFMIDLVMDEDLDKRAGTLDVDLLGDLTVFYVPISTNATAVLPSGGAAAWVCGDRAFGWKVYVPQAEMARRLFEEAISKFSCTE